jgi:hypothetical protein
MASGWPAAYYLHQRTQGKPHHTAVRALGFKWQRVIFRCGQAHTPYSDARYEQALKQAGSPVAALFDQVELGKSPFKTAVKKS